MGRSIDALLPRYKATPPEGGATKSGLENQLDSRKGNPRDGKGVKDDPLGRRFWPKVDRRGEGEAER
jgi:hypothetical protein